MYPISTSKNNTKHLILIFSILIFLSGLVVLIKSLHSPELEKPVFSFLIHTGISFVLFYWFKKFKKEPIVQFDKKYLYIGVQKVDLKYVTKIERSVIQGNNTNNWIIYFLKNNMKSTIKIDITFRKSAFNKFKKIVQSANSKAKIDSVFWQ